MTDGLPRVTVVVPVHDREQMLFAHALPSALGQRDVDVDVVVVCDGSPERLVRRVESFADPRVSVVRHPEPRGVAAARNAGIDAATGDWVAILDDDDLWAPTKLAEQVAAADRAGAGFAYSAAVIVDAQLRVKSLTPAPDPASLLVDLLARNVMPGGGSNVMARRHLLRTVGGFDPGLRYASDWDIAIRLADASTGARVHDPLVAWVRHEGATAPLVGVARRDLERLRERHDDLFRRHGATIDVGETLRWVAHSELETGRPGHRLRAARAFAHAAWETRRPSYLGHAGRALLGARANAAVRERLRSRPPRPEWLAALQAGALAPSDSVLAVPDREQEHAR